MCSETLKYLLFLVVFLNTTNGMSKGFSGSHCDANSECILLKECTSLMNYLKTLERPLKGPVVDFLKTQQCGFQAGYPKVCCSIDSKNSPSSKEQLKADKNSCRTKTECVILRRCRPYMDLINALEKPLKASIVEFLRTQHCGFEEGYPKVCCSLLPKNLHALKHASGESRPQVNKAHDKWLSFMDINAPTTPTSSTKLDIIDITDKTTTVKSKVNKNTKEKAEAVNKAFAMYDFFDFVGPYDLFRRKRFDDDEEIDIEIR